MIKKVQPERGNWLILKDSTINIRFRTHTHMLETHTHIVKHTHNFSHVYNVSKANRISTLSLFSSPVRPFLYQCHPSKNSQIPSSVTLFASLSSASSSRSYIDTHFPSTHTYKLAQMIVLVGGVGWCPGVPVFCDIAFHIFHFHSPELC